MDPRNEMSHTSIKHYESAMLTGLRRGSRASFFSLLPTEITALISHYYDFDTKSEIGVALSYAADARQGHVNELMRMLEKKPHLLLQRGRVITPGGDDVRGITLYEYCLAAGDSTLASDIQLNFEKITGINGKTERASQYERYKAFIDGMMKQTPYDLSSLMDIIMKASAIDVDAILNKDMTHKSTLHEAMSQFRKDHAPRVITEPRMHFDYHSFCHAVSLYEDKIPELYSMSSNNNKKIRLAWRYVILFLLRRLPGGDRCRLAAGLCNNNWKRTYRFASGSGEFPVTMNDDSSKGLGWGLALNLCNGAEDSGSECKDILKEFILKKQNELMMLDSKPSNGCVLI